MKPSNTLKNIKKQYQKLVLKYGKDRAIVVGINYVLYKIFPNTIIKLMRKCARKVNSKYILFESKPDFADNGRALSDYIVENGYSHYRIIWLVEEPKLYDEYKSKQVKFVRSIGKRHQQRTISAYYYALKSKYIFFTHAFKWVGKKLPEQVYVNLWHGCGYKASRRDPNKKEDMNIFDFCLVPGDVFVETKAEFFCCDKKQILPLGYPRYNLYKHDNKRVDEYFASLGGKDRKNILWMPTFVQSKDLIYYKNPIPSIIGLPLINSITDMDRLEKICADNNINLIIKRHRIGSKLKNSDEVHEGAHVFYLDNDKLDELGIQLYEMIAKSDALITDFSSVAIDYILLDKPIGFTLEDLEDYSKTRGFVFEDPKKYMPGEHMYSFEDLEIFIKNVSRGIDSAVEQRRAVIDETHNRTDDYCARILEHFGINRG